MNIIKMWIIAHCGWSVYRAEVAALTRGRDDLKIVATKPGVLMLVEVA